MLREAKNLGLSLDELLRNTDKLRCFASLNVTASSIS